MDPEATVPSDMKPSTPPPNYPPPPVGFVQRENGDHSMPTIEEIRTEGVINQGGSYTNRYSGKNKRRAFLVAISVATVALVTGFSIASIQNHRGSGSSNSAASASSQPGEIPHDTSVPTTATASSRLQEVQDFLTLKVSPNEVLQNDASPQHHAARWIADEDALKMDIPSDPSYATSFDFVQRYILAVFYYALDGPNWTNQMSFLGAASVCDWNAAMVAPDNTPWRLGVFCNDNGAVAQISISASPSPVGISLQLPLSTL